MQMMHQRATEVAKHKPENRCQYRLSRLCHRQRLLPIDDFCQEKLPGRNKGFTTEDTKVHKGKHKYFDSSVWCRSTEKAFSTPLFATLRVRVTEGIDDD